MLFSRADRPHLIELVREGASLVEREGARVVELEPGSEDPIPVARLADDATERRTELGSERAAAAELGQRAARLVDIGWTIIRIDDDAAWPVACDPAMEAAIDAAVDDRGEQLSVYADWLNERGDPRGEIVAMRGGGKPWHHEGLAAAIAAFEAEHGDAIYGAFWALPERLRAQLTLLWSDGWIDGLEVNASIDGSVLTLALHAPLARFVSRLAVSVYSFTAVPWVLERSPRRSTIRCLALATRTTSAQELLDALPALEELDLIARTPTPGGHPTVRRLGLVVERARSHAADAPGLWLEGPWPALRRLEVTVPGPTAPRLMELAHVDAPALAELVLASHGHLPALMLASLLEIPSSPLARRLELLTVVGTVGDALRRRLADELPHVAIHYKRDPWPT